MSEQYTPTTDEVRANYQVPGLYSGLTAREAGARFERWLAKRDAEVAAKAWDEGFSRGFYRGQILNGDYDASEAGIDNPYRKAVQS